MGSNLARTGKKPENEKEAASHERRAGQQEEPVWRVHQHESQAAPSVAETSEVGRPAALVRPENNGNLADPRADLPGLDDHLERKFHPRTADVQPVIEGAREPTHTAITVADAHVEEQIEQGGEAGISEIPVEWRHGAGFDAAAEAVAHDDVVAFPQFFHESRHVAEVIAVVGVAHDDECAMRGRNAGAQRGSITALRYADHTRSVLLGNLDRAVRRSVVGDDDFAGKACLAECLRRLIHAEGQRVGLIQAGDDHGYIGGLRLVGPPGKCAFGSQYRVHRPHHDIALRAPFHPGPVMWNAAGDGEERLERSADLWESSLTPVFFGHRKMQTSPSELSAAKSIPEG